MVTSRAQGGLGRRETGKLGPNSLEETAIMTDPPVRMAPDLCLTYYEDYLLTVVGLNAYPHNAESTDNR